MTLLDAVRDRLSSSDASADPTPSHGDAPADSTQSDPPFDGYDSLGDREVMNGLSDHSQVELEAVEGYERSHQDRKVVIDKLRYMRQDEPLPGYDALDIEEVVTALEAADLPTIRLIRGYERKFANRPDVLEKVVHVHHERLASEPKAAAPGYQPMSAK